LYKKTTDNPTTKLKKNGQCFINMVLDNIKSSIFRAYDIRGVYNQDISGYTFYMIGLGFGTYVKRKLKGKSIVIGNDIRFSSLPLAYAFISGVSATGINITYTGTTSFGQTLFSGWSLGKTACAFITASHLPPEWNGIKFYHTDGVGFSEEELKEIRDIILENTFELVDWERIGKIILSSPAESYKKFFLNKFNYPRKIKVALDCGGGSTTLSAPDIFKALGLDVFCLFCNPDPTFSDRPSDPKPENLSKLVETVIKNNCDFGVAFDGDGDRAVIVDDTGKILSADETGIILAKYGLKKQEGVIIANVECSKIVNEQLEPLGFRIKQIPVGHTFLTIEAKREKSPLGIESSGHLILPEYFLFDDALVVPLKIAEILAHSTTKLSKLIKEIPTYPRKKLEVECEDELKFDVINALTKELTQKYEKVNTIDGVRVELEKGWVLIRASNTSPIIRMTVEANDKDTVNELEKAFMELISKRLEALKNR